MPLVKTRNETVKVQKEYQIRIGNKKNIKILYCISISGLVCYLKKNEKRYYKSICKKGQRQKQEKVKVPKEDQIRTGKKN